MENIKFSKVRQDYYPLGGGLDLVTPAIAINAGKVIDSQNYEPAIGGGYRRIDGYERFDGRANPTSATYFILPVVLLGVVVVGNTITGVTSAATGIVLAKFPNYLVCGRVIGTFSNAESITVSAVNVGVINNLVTSNSASGSNHADYALLAANDLRALIQVVPGSGRIRGVWVYNDIVYAFRDNVSGTANIMFKATTNGWVQINFLTEIRFNAAVVQINIGDTITGGTSGAIATVTVALLTSGTWIASGIGSLVLSSVVGTFVSGEALKVSGVTKVTSTTASIAIVRAPGGTMEFFNYNFFGSFINNVKMYGVDGINPTFEFDGITYVPIHTGMAIDTPSHVIAHKGFLFLSFNASVQYSALGNPYSWSVVLGAGEIDTSKPTTGFLPQGGNLAGSSLAIFTGERTFILYGSSNADFKLVSSIFDMGYLPFTLQQVSNDAYGMTSRGIQALITTLNYGDFDYASISHMIQPLITKKRGLEISSNSIRTKNQYRVYFSDGTALATGLTGEKISGIMLLNYSKPVRCICTANLSNGNEVTYFGSDDGYVYQDNIGTSQDGNMIEAWLRMPFNNDKSPRVRKRFRRAILEMSIDSFSKVNISYDLGYSDPNVQPSAIQSDTSLTGAGGYWEQFVWDQFNWDSQFISNPVLPIEGTEKNISFIFYSNRAQDQSHTIQGITIISTPQILQR